MIINTKEAKLAEKQISYNDLRQGEKVTLKLREGESVIVGTVAVLPTPGGGAKIALTNNANSVVIYESTNFRIFADRGPTIQEILGELNLGTVFEYRNKHNKTLKWVKTGSDRVTLISDSRPAYSLSISEGFTDQGDADARLSVIY